MLQIELTRGYDYAAFREDLKQLYDAAGSKGQPTVFLFTDTQIVVEEFLEDINNILNSGEVPNLFESDELEKCLAQVRPACKEAGLNEQVLPLLQNILEQSRMVCIHVMFRIETKCIRFSSEE